MSYDYRLLCERISLCLHGNPKSSLRWLSRELQVSPRTIQNAVIRVTGKTFTKVRDEYLLEGIRDLLVSAPNATIRKVSLEAGYRCARSSARLRHESSAAAHSHCRTTSRNKIDQAIWRFSWRGYTTAIQKITKRTHFCVICPDSPFFTDYSQDSFQVLLTADYKNFNRNSLAGYVPKG